MNLALWLQRASRARPDLPAVALGDLVVSDYGRLARRCAGLAAALREGYGLEPGDRVAIVAKNHPAYFEALFGTWWAGLTSVPVNARLHPSEIGWILEHAQARAVLVSGDLEAAVGGLALPDVRVLLAFDGEEHERAVAHEPAPIETRDPDDLAWLFYTSGTTGRPKGAMLTHRNLAAMSLAHLCDLDHVSPGDALLHAAPLSHGSGLLAIPHLCRMGLNVVPESGGFDAPEVFGLIAAHRNASMFAAPTMVRRMVECPEDVDAGAIGTIVFGGAPMLVPDTIAALDRLGPCLAQLYGQGESPMTITALAKEDVADREHPRWLERLASAGLPRSAVEVRVAGEDGEPVPTGETGEVLVRGDTVMRGYWRDDEATAETLRGGWLHTGDLGSIDEAGYLTLKDRSKDLIISGGSNVYPREVEEVLIAHPRVREVSVIGRPDAEWGEVVVAYVSGEASADELDELCLERIARFKRPKDYVFVESLPKSNYGKILKTELRALDEARAKGAIG
jgi:long-chain acyl-CoA synthetase